MSVGEGQKWMLHKRESINTSLILCMGSLGTQNTAVYPPDQPTTNLLAIKKPSIPSGTLNIEISSECDISDRQSDISHSLHQEIHIILY